MNEFEPMKQAPMTSTEPLEHPTAMLESILDMCLSKGMELEKAGFVLAKAAEKFLPAVIESGRKVLPYKSDTSQEQVLELKKRKPGAARSNPSPPQTNV